MSSFSLDTIRPISLDEDESNLCVIIHDNPLMNKMELLVEPMRLFGWDHTKFNEIYRSLINKGIITVIES